MSGPDDDERPAIRPSRPRHGLPELIAERRAKARAAEAGRRGARSRTRSRTSSRSRRARRLRAPRSGRGDRRAPPRRRPARGAPRLRRRGVPRPRRPHAARSSCTPASTCSARRRFERLTSLDLGDLIGVDGAALRTRRGELSLRVDGFRGARQGAAPAAGQAPRPDRRRDALPPPRARPDRQRGRAQAVHRPREDHLGGARLPRRRGLHRGRDAGAAAALRRRAGAAVHDPPQRARPRPVPADRHRAVPQAADRRRPRARLRARQGLPQRGPLDEAQPRVHDGRVVRGLRRLRGRGAAPGRAGARRRGARSATPASSTSPRRGGASASSRRSSRRPASTCARSRDAASLRAAIAERGLEIETRGRQLGAARRRPALEVRRAEAAAADVRRSTIPSSSRRSRASTAREPGSSSAGRRSPAASRSPTPSASSTTPTSSASASRPSERLADAAATRRRSPTTSCSCRRSSRACRRPAASGSASTGS